MSESTANANAPEPTMEEILASIRRIISEDDAPAAAAEADPAPAGDPPIAAAAVEPEPEPAAVHHDDVLELTERVEPEPEPVAAPTPVIAAAPPPMPKPQPEPPASSLGDIDFAAPPAPASRVPERSEEPLVSSRAADRAADHFGALTSNLSMPASGRTLEDVTRELLRPLLKEWLDANLARIVEERVQDEVERISRRRSY